MKSDEKKISILGCGWLGLPLGKHLLSMGYTVKGSTTTPAKLSRLETAGFEPYLIHVKEDVSGDIDAFLDIDVLIINFPPERRADIADYHVRQFEALIPHIERSKVKRVLFSSSTSVYADTNQVVTEEDSNVPDKKSGLALRKVEQLLKTNQSFATTVLRIGGLIGGDRLPKNGDLGKRQLKSWTVPVNLIHQEDVIMMMVQILQQEAWGEVYNACTDEHPLRKDYYQAAAEHFGYQLPLVNLKNDSGNYKIVSNEKIKSHLGLTLKFPDPIMVIGLEKGKHTHIDNKPVSIVGAGPGDPELLTMKAHKRISSADIILYDNLVDDQVMALVPATVEKIYVGKKYGDQTCQSTRQQNINDLMVRHYNAGKAVVRLKSGDPHIFGRAGEEVRYLMERSIPFEVIPGISAGIAAAANCSIPLTERKKTREVVFCTGHIATDANELQLSNVKQMLESGTNMVVYMGLSSWSRVVEEIRSLELNCKVNVTAVSKVSRPDEKWVTGDLDNIAQKIKQENLKMPVVFFIGQYAVPIQTDTLKTEYARVVQDTTDAMISNN